MRSNRRLLVFHSWLLAACFAVQALAEGTIGDRAALSWTAITVTPAEPSADQLCELAVEFENNGKKTASRFAFSLTIDGQDQPAYRGRLFLEPLPPGQKKTLKLFNFWSTEPSRPQLTPGQIELRLTLEEARWVEQDGSKEINLGPVEGLPITRTLTLELR